MQNAAESHPQRRSAWLVSEDWWAVWIGLALFGASVAGWIRRVPKPSLWHGPVEALNALDWAGLLPTFAWLLGTSALAVHAMGLRPAAYVPGFVGVSMLAVLANLLGAQATVESLGLEAALFALSLGLLIANTVGTPPWLLRGARSELFIKNGLVIMGAEILARNMLALGGPGLVVAWGVTPLVIVSMWWLGTRVIRLPSKQLVMVIACATSVCGVSAAIASAAACRAKKEELTLAVGMSMIFTVGMMIGMPALCRLLELDQQVGGAWIGGTVDSTGAVVAAGALLGEQAEKVAAIVKMIQNTMIGIISFVIAVYWVSVIEREPAAPKPSFAEVWRRFPKFVLGFLGTSLLSSFVVLPWLGEQGLSVVTSTTKGLRTWWFALAFTAIGLESNFRQLASQLVGGKPIWLYAAGQSWNILLTLLAAYLAFGKAW